MIVYYCFNTDLYLHIGAEIIKFAMKNKVDMKTNCSKLFTFWIKDRKEQVKYTIIKKRFSFRKKKCLLFKKKN